MSKIFSPGIRLTGIVTRPDSDLQKAILYAFVDDDGQGITVRHRPEITPQILIELGEKISEIGRRLQQ